MSPADSTDDGSEESPEGTSKTADPGNDGSEPSTLDDPDPTDDTIPSTTDDGMLEETTAAASDEGNDDPLVIGEPELVDGIHVVDVNDDGVTLTGDLLEMYFASDRTGVRDIYRAVRESVDLPFGTPELILELSTPDFTEASPEITPDGLIMTFVSNRPGGLLGFDLYASSRDSRELPWNPPIILGKINSDFDEFGAFVLPTAEAFYLCTNNASQQVGNADLVRVIWIAPTDEFGETRVVEALSSAVDDCSAWVSADETIVIFTRPSPAGDLDLYISRATGNGLSEPAPIVELNTEANEDSPWVSPDLSTLFFASSASGVSQIVSVGLSL